MRETFVEAKAIIEESGYTLERIREYLDEMRDTGRINMFGAGDYLINVWGFSRQEARPIVLDYIEHGLRENPPEPKYLYGNSKAGDA